MNKFIFHKIRGSFFESLPKEDWKFQTITDKGEFLLEYIKNSHVNIRKSNRGSHFFNVELFKQILQL